MADKKHPLDAQLRDPAVTLPLAIELALAKAAQFENHLAEQLQVRFMEMEQIHVRLTEARFWCGELAMMIKQVKKQGAEPGIVIAQDLPPDVARRG